MDNHMLSPSSSMVCSVSARKSGPKWLDRLRLSRGFPSGVEAADLENFLNNPTSPELKQPDPVPNYSPEAATPRNYSASDGTQNEDKQLLDIMSNALFDLFNFGDSYNCSYQKIKKPSRKQSNPRICINSNNNSNENKNAHSEKSSRSDDNNSGVRGLKESSENLAPRENEEERDESKVNLFGFSQTEVTVIDTSYKWWKFEKLLYRKKNVWKVRDKKGSSVNVGSKNKRKARPIISDGDDVGENKQKAVAKEGESAFASKESTKSGGHQKAVDGTGKILKKKQTNLKLEKGSTSVILIKSIPTSKKTGTR